MRKYIACFLLLVLLAPILLFKVNASEITKDIIRFDDGSYAIIETVTNGMRASGTVSGSKNYTYYDNNGVSQWKVVLTGKFTYTGSSATCTSSSVDVTISNSMWYTISKSAEKSGNEAETSVRMGEKLNGLTVRVVPVNLTLTCDANGNLS